MLRWLNTFPQTSQRPPRPAPGPVLGRPRSWPRPRPLGTRQRALASMGPRSWPGSSFMGFCSPPGPLGSTTACEKPLSQEGDCSWSVRPAMLRSQGMWRWGLTVPGPAETLSMWSANPGGKMPPASSCHRAPGCTLHEGPSSPVSLWGEAWSSTISQPWASLGRRVEVASWGVARGPESRSSRFSVTVGSSFTRRPSGDSCLTSDGVLGPHSGV